MEKQANKAVSEKKKIYKKWWIKLLIAPIIVGIILTAFNLLVKPKNQEKNISTITINGDFVGRDKYEINLSNPIEYKDLDKIYIEEIKIKINQLKRKYSDIKIKILFQIINANKGTEDFAYEFKKIMEDSGISVRVVPHTIVGGPHMDFPLYFRYKGLEEDLVIDYIQSIAQFFSPVKGPINIPKPSEVENIAEGFNLVIQVYKNVFFDQKGRIYF